MIRAKNSIATCVQLLLNAAAAAAVLAAIFTGLNIHRMPNGLGDFLAMRVTVKNVIVMALFVAGWTASFHAFGLIGISSPRRLRTVLSRVTKAVLCAAPVGLLVSLSTGATPVAGVAASFLPVGITVGVVSQLLAGAISRRIGRSIMGLRETIIVGSGPRALDLFEHLSAPQRSGAKVLGFVDSPNGHSVPSQVRERMIGTLDDLEAILTGRPVDEVVIALPAKSCYDQIQTTITTCERVGVEAKYRSDIFELGLARPEFQPDDRTPVVSLKVVHDDFRIFVKRWIDIIGSASALILLAPLLLVIAAAVRFTSQGAVLFVQERYGFNRRRFRMLKFRTMVQNAEAIQDQLEGMNEKSGPIFKIARDPRVTPIGRFLRRTSLDELPQLWNVLKGDMSLVGPRPMSVRDVSRFDEAWLMRRFSVRPGLTCLWQIGGRSNTTFTRWMELDLKYIDSWSLRLDLSILLRTLPAVLRHEGAM
ncbi:MAG TPA: sugar transferase [Bryobacteraceae bacterium]|nr:sugar transferase [Bryobacteraceae bacterium]